MKIKTSVITFLLFIIVTQVFSQTENSGQVYFLQFKSYVTELDEAVPFVDFSIMKNDSILHQSRSDFDGITELYINNKGNNIDSIFLKIKYQIGHMHNEVSNPINISLSNIELFEEIDIDNYFQIILTEYKILSSKEVNRLHKKQARMPDRKDIKAIDVD